MQTISRKGENLNNLKNYYKYEISDKHIIYHASKKHFPKLLCELFDVKMLYKQPDEGIIINNNNEYRHVPKFFTYFNYYKNRRFL